jgi:hypothetical protein
MLRNRKDAKAKKSILEMLLRYMQQEGAEKLALLARRHCER